MISLVTMAAQSVPSLAYCHDFRIPSFSTSPAAASVPTPRPRLIYRATSCRNDNKVYKTTMLSANETSQLCSDPSNHQASSPPVIGRVWIAH